MVDLVRLLRSLPRRSPTELVGRGRQAAAVALERAGLSSLTRLPSDDALVRMWGGRAEGVDDLLADFRSRPATMFLPAFGDTSATIAAFRQRWRARTDAIIAAAERAAGGRINLLGWRDVDVGDPPDWHRDPVLGVRSPRLHWSRIHYLEPTVVGDHKLVWEINRHQHFSLLGRAYLLTGEARFAEAFVRHVTDWMDANPPKAGVNWASSLEVALRAIAWIWALHFFRDSDPLRPEVFSRLLRYLYLHGRHIETYLSTYFSPNTHLTGEALGLIYLGSVFPELDRADHWRRLGWRILLDGLDRQVHEDGVYFERAACYHRYTVDFCVHARLLAGLTRDARAARLDPLLDALFEHLLHLTRPDGRVPAVGDDDGGRLLPLSDGPPADARPALAVGSVLLRRPDLAAVAGEDAAEELLWLLGPGAVERFERMERRRPSRTAAAFADGRFYVARDGWSEHANYIIIDAGAGGGPTGGHAHANPLGVELSACGTPVIVDPGTFTYTVDDGLRDHFRGSIAHNTVSIDGEPAALPGSAFGWRRLPKVRTDRWLARERFTLFEGEHDGFTRLSAPAVHRRAILFLKGGYWIIRDRIDSTGRHRVDVRYQFAPGALVDLRADDRAHASWPPQRGRSGERRVAATGVELVAVSSAGGGFTLEDGWTSSIYGARERAPALRYSSEARGDQDITTLLLPRSPTTRGVRVVRREAEGGVAWNIADHEHRDLVIVSEAAETEIDGVRSDGRWTWIRSAPDSGDVIEFLLVDGGTLSVDGRPIIEADRRTGFVAGALRDGVLRLETDARGDVTLNVRRVHTIVAELGRELAAPERRVLRLDPADAGGTARVTLAARRGA